MIILKRVVKLIHIRFFTPAFCDKIGSWRKNCLSQMKQHIYIYA